MSTMTEMPDVATLVGALRNILLGGADPIHAINATLRTEPHLPLNRVVDEEAMAPLSAALDAARALVERADRAARG